MKRSELTSIIKEEIQKIFEEEADTLENNDEVTDAETKVKLDNKIRRIFDLNQRDLQFLIDKALDTKNYKEVKRLAQYLKESERKRVATLILEVLNEENILIPRRLEGRRELYVKKLKAMLQQKHIEGDLDLSEVPEITDLGNVETIGGDLNLYNSNVASLGNLTSVGGYLNLYHSKVASLGNLISVGGDLDVSNSKVASLGNLTSVGGDLDLSGSKVASLEKLTSVGGNLWLYDNKVASLGNLTSVGGNLNLEDSKVASLGNLTSVGGELYLYGSKVNSLGNLKKVGNSIYIDQGQFSEELLDKYKKLFPGKIRFWKNGKWKILK